MGEKRYLSLYIRISWESWLSLFALGICFRHQGLLDATAIVNLDSELGQQCV